MQTKNENDKYQLASTDEYGIKTTKGGQKYLICSFVEDNIEGKYTYDGVQNDTELCTSILLEKEKKSEYYYEPYKSRAIGYVIGNYNELIGFSVTNASTDTKGTKNLEIDKPESEFIGKLSDNLRNFKPYKIEVSDQYWELLKNAVNNLENVDQLTLHDKLQKISEEYWQAQSKYKALSGLIEKSESLFTRLKNIARATKVKSVDELKDAVVLSNKQSNFPKNNQMNINGAKIKSMIINITNLDRKIQMTDKIKTDRLKEIVKNINEIIDIQYNKLGHKSILVRDAGSKEITKMELDKFVDYIKDECKKAGITEEQIKQINPDFLTKKKVHKIIHGRWCRFKKWFKNLFSRKANQLKNEQPVFHVSTHNGKDREPISCC